MKGQPSRPYELRHRPRSGTAPGTLVAPPGARPPTINVMAYGDDELIERADVSLDEVERLLGRHALVWVDVRGLGDAETIAQLGQLFDLHPLALEDVLNTHQRPKVEHYDESSFIITRLPHLTDEALELEQISLFLADGLVVSVQEQPADCFDPVRTRIRKHAGNRGRLLRADYLAYALLDAVVDSYFPLLEQYAERIEGLEERTVSRPEHAGMLEIQRLKRELLQIRRAIWPQRELFRGLREGEGRLAGDTGLFLRDCEDHVLQIMDLLEIYRERLGTAVDLHVSALSHRMNEVMKVLTIIATLFMPMTVITGIYGMNFDPAVSPWNMPELGWRYGYPFALGLLVGVGALLLFYFRRLGWLGR
ncbi:magnesium/cobalt transporter CorA [Sediminicurvatus halobius]|uniref:Magnesium transport protein CorA n=1 Tax=Sediminicurvatus halobius TaxID=2182432 RepID=A0A2U2N9C8_9GAMM|nr:magnesium/cobalt transporter CorA [Spiribacter halobius]PWG65805.1 magnesium and cobalt transport protein CorA [Spiribacter halobius]UEX77847.1 magnesium/cobalt transporter CorA [Spiribacter halobius]